MLTLRKQAWAFERPGKFAIILKTMMLKDPDKRLRKRLFNGY